MAKFQFLGGGREREGGYSTVLKVGHSQNFEPKFTVQPETCLCITDSLSHTTYVETNKVLERGQMCKVGIIYS